MSVAIYNRWLLISVDKLYGYQLEADSCIAFHAKYADINDPGEIVMWANDTDVAIVLLLQISISLALRYCINQVSIITILEYTYQ